MGEWIRRLLYLLRWRRRDAELADEMEFHREMVARAGRKNFGNTLRLREEAGEAWGWTWLERLLQDLRFGARLWFRSPGFAIASVLVLAIGVGVNVGAFSLFDDVALKSLPVRDADRIVRLERRSPSNYTSEMAYPSFLFYRKHAQTLSATMAVLGVPPMQIDDDLEPTSASFVTENYFAELGTPAACGRMFDTSVDALPDSPPAAVISFGLWQQRFGGDANVIGRLIHLNGQPVTVVGVTPKAFASLGGQHPALWLPISKQPYLVAHSKVLEDWTNASVRMWGKLAPGVGAKTAEDELRALTDQLRHAHPDAVWDNEYIQSSPGGHLQVMTANTYRVAEICAVLTLLILIVTCTNLGGLMLARGATREREIGIRVSIGAGRARIFRQLWTESLLLAAMGSLAGLALATVVMRAVLNRSDAPKWLSPWPDWRVAAFTVGMSVATTLFFGLAPALQMARQKRPSTRLRHILIAAQVAACSVLLVAAALLLRATQHAIYTDPGFAYEQLLSMDPQLGRHDYKPEAARAYFDQMESRLRALPGVASVSLAKLPPLGHAVVREDREIRGRAVKVFPNWAAPDFFRTMQIPLRQGRTFDPREKNVVIVSESFARAQWPGENPLGQQIGDGTTKDVVVGVAGDAHINAMNDDDAVEQYWPAQTVDLPDMVMVIRSEGDPAAISQAAEAASRGIDASLFPEIRRIQTLYNKDLQNLELLAAIVSVIGMAAAVAISCVGIVGLVAFTVRQRRKEIAIRMALGADSGSVLAAVLGPFRWPVLIGLAIGVALSVAGSGMLRQALYGVSNLDLASYLGGCGALVALVGISIFVPAAHAARVNLADTLHSE
ncbi:MAG: ABC transporter permease [Candidatus Acidiferrales bacterium]